VREAQSPPSRSIDLPLKIVVHCGSSPNKHRQFEGSLRRPVRHFFGGRRMSLRLREPYPAWYTPRPSTPLGTARCDLRNESVRVPTESGRTVPSRPITHLDSARCDDVYFLANVKEPRQFESRRPRKKSSGQLGGVGGLGLGWV